MIFDLVALVYMLVGGVQDIERTRDGVTDLSNQFCFTSWDVMDEGWQTRGV